MRSAKKYTLVNHEKGYMRKIIAFMVIALVAINANAEIIQVYSPQDLGAGSFATENFEDNVFESGVTFGTTAGEGGVSIVPASTWAGGVTPSGASGLSNDNISNLIRITFDSPTTSLGLFFGNDDTCCSLDFFVFMDIFGVDTYLGSIGVIANMNSAADQFLGFKGDEMVTHVDILYGSGIPYMHQYIDDLVFKVSEQEVPEPAGILIFTLGLIGIAVSRRRFKI